MSTLRPLLYIVSTLLLVSGCDAPIEEAKKDDAVSQAAEAPTEEAGRKSPATPATKAKNKTVTQATSAPVESVTTTTPAEAEKTKPITLAPNSPAYTLRPGDLLHISVWKEEELDREVLVLPDGTIDFPLIGSFTAAGLTPTSVQTVIKQKLKSYIPAATVTVVVKETRGNSISVTGQVARPGEIVMNRKMTILQALSQVGGLTTYADEDDIMVLRTVDGKETSIPFDYSDVASGRKLETNILLEPGDVIIVPTASLF